MKIVSLDQFQAGLEKAKSYTDSVSSGYVNLIDYDSVEAVEDAVFNFGSTVLTLDAWQSAVFPVAAGRTCTVAAGTDEVCIFSIIWLDSGQEEIGTVVAAAENGTFEVAVKAEDADTGETVTAPDGACYAYVRWSSYDGSLSTESDLMAYKLGLTATGSADIALIGPTGDDSLLTAGQAGLFDLLQRVIALEALTAELEEKISGLTDADESSE